MALKLESMKMRSDAKKVRDSIQDTLSYYHFSDLHWQRIRTNNPLEKIMKEIRRLNRLVGAFPDRKSALMLVGTRLRHIAGKKWGTKRYLNMKLFYVMTDIKEKVA